MAPAGLTSQELLVQSIDQPARCIKGATALVQVKQLVRLGAVAVMQH
jgi:hypothetical protein